MINQRLMVAVLVLYNVMLFITVLLFTTKPIVAGLFIAIDLFFIFYFMWVAARQKLEERKFKVEHGELIKQAMLELHEEEKLDSDGKKSRWLDSPEREPNPK